MVEQHSDSVRTVIRGRSGLIVLVATLLAVSVNAFAATKAVTVSVTDPSGSPITVDYRWLLEEDATIDAAAPYSLETTQATNLHRSNMPVIKAGHSTTGVTTITVPDDTKRYYLSVLPDQPVGSDCQTGLDCYTMSGQRIDVDDMAVHVIVTPQPLPTAQVFLRAFEDNAPINNAWDTGEIGLGGFTVFIYDFSGGQLSVDNYGNPLGTEYEGLDSVDSTPRVRRLGDGSIHTVAADEVDDPVRNPYGLAVGEALIKNLAPGRYGVRVVPPYKNVYDTADVWQQTTTIEGTPGQDVWLKAGEPRYFAEFGPAGHHAEFGFVRPANFTPLSGGGSISGTVRNLRMARPPVIAWAEGNPLAGCWVGLNDQLGTTGLYAAPCAEDSTFTIPDVPAGTYQLVIFDTYLDLIFNIQTVDVGVNGAPMVVEVPDQITRTFRWFGTQEHYVFLDDGCGDPRFAEDGIRQACESPIPEQAINLRFRDGSIYQASATDLDGYLPLEEVFPFFSWNVAEVDYLRFKPTGVTIAVDNGGPVKGSVGDFTPGDFSINSIGDGRLNPQIQNPKDGGTNCDLLGENCLTRTETGPTVLLEGYNAFIGSNARFEWGKVPYKDGENGGIAGIVFYATTRAENDPRFAAGEPWEPGIPHVQMNLYRANKAGNIYHINSDGSQGPLHTTDAPHLADVDNYPFCWSDPDSAADATLCPGGSGPVTVLNASFEAPDCDITGACNHGLWTDGVAGVTDWTVSGVAGVFDPEGYDATLAAPVVLLVPTDGDQVGYSNGGSLSQTTTEILTANTTYTLSVDIGDRADTPFVSGTIELRSGATVLATATSSPTSLPFPANPGDATSSANWVTLTASYTTGATVALTDPITIVLSGGGSQTEFDNVRLERNGPTAVSPRILLSMINAGLENYAPQLLGGYFNVIAEDGHLAPTSRSQYSAFLPAAKSLDVLFSPAAPGVYTLFDRRLRLVNDTALGGGMLHQIVVD